MMTIASKNAYISRSSFWNYLPLVIFIKIWEFQILAANHTILRVFLFIQTENFFMIYFHYFTLVHGFGLQTFTSMF